MKLSEKIKKIREQNGYTQEELALKIGIPQRILQNYEVGTTKKNTCINSRVYMSNFPQLYRLGYAF